MSFISRLSLVILIAVVPFPSAVIAATPTPGRWAVRAGGRPLLVLELRKDPSAKGGWRGSLTKPMHFTADSKFTVVSNVEGPAIKALVINAGQHAGELELDLRERSSGVEHVIWRPSDDGGGTMSFADPLAPVLTFKPAGASERVPNAWNKTKYYSAMPEWRDNVEMSAIFRADQAARQDANIDWTIVGPQDEARRVRTKALLDSGALRTANDFYNAAFIFQHGDTAGDYLMAHTLAVIAAARGRINATWIAAATLDRYLQTIGQKQIYGTQFLTPRGGSATQEPFDRLLVPDALRAALGVPPLADQEKQRKTIDDELKKGNVGKP